MSDVVQIPFSAFKLIDLGQSVGLSVYQSLYKDHSEPIGLISVVQALGLLQPSEQAIELFNKKWTKESVRWKLQETGIEVVTGKSSTTAEMAKTREGEAALLVLSFLIEMLGAKTTSDLARHIIDTTPVSLLPIKPRRAQVNSIVAAIESQTTCVSWHQEISNAQDSVCERPVVWTPADDPLPSVSFDLPVEAMQAFYQALCTISRFPTDYYCILRTPLSITLAFALAHSICGLRVCVVVDDEVVHGNPAAGRWQVRLERSHAAIDKPKSTQVRLGRKLEDAQDLLVIDEVGPLRANRISIGGIAKATTIGQGLGSLEGEELAIIAVGAAVSILEKWQREAVDESGSDDASSVVLSDPETLESTESSTDDAQDDIFDRKLVPVKTRVTIDAIARWWDCSARAASTMLAAAQATFDRQPRDASWTRLQYSRIIMGNISEFESLSDEQKMTRRSQTNHAADLRDHARLTHMLTTQLLLIAFLQCSASTKTELRVRSTCLPQNSELGRAIKTLGKPDPLHQSDALYSWYYWLHGKPAKMPEAKYGLDVVTTDGYIIYRSLLLDFGLGPESCEKVTIEPGHILSDDQRIREIRGPDNGYSVIQEPHYRNMLHGRAKLRSKDHTGPLGLGWSVTEGDDSLELEFNLTSKSSGLEVSGSVFQVVKQSWTLQYGDRLLGCNHDEDRVGALIEGEKVEVVSAGALRSEPSSWKPLLLLSANGNDLGQVACLLSAPENSRGMVRRDACLRCCITSCNKKGLDFLID